jgi:predicted GNAT family acetyltransferase
MGWQFTISVHDFADAAAGFLAADPERHSVALTTIESVRSGVRWSDEAMHFGWWSDRGRVRAAAILTPPNPLVLFEVPEVAARDLVSSLRARDAAVTIVNGEPAEAETFARIWLEGTQSSSVHLMGQRLYRLEQFRDPDRPAPGHGRLAAEADLDLVTAWYADFHTEAYAEPVTIDQLRETASRRINLGLLWLWEDDGTPVAMAARNPTTAGVARLGPVFTPPVSRGRGYGTAVTAACTRDALDAGARGVVLFTDLANPTSNAIYQAIGYRPITDRVLLQLPATAAHSVLDGHHR